MLAALHDRPKFSNPKVGIPLVPVYRRLVVQTRS
jgi:hypothetical protein